MFERILVPLDGSKAAEMSLPYAEDIAARLGRALIAASVAELGLDSAEQLCQAYIERIAEQARRRFSALEAQRPIEVSTAVLKGPPAREILRYAESLDASLIVMTNRGSSIPGPWPLGQVVGKVLRATTRPLLLIRKEAGQRGTGQGQVLKRILVPLDGSRLGASALPHAETLAGGLGAELVLLHVLEPAASWASYAGGALPYYETSAVLENRKTQAGMYLDGVAKTARETGVNVSTVVVLGTPAEEIVDFARTESIDLIAMSTHGRTGISKWVFGNITDKVLHVGNTAVLVIGPPRA